MQQTQRPIGELEWRLCTELEEYFAKENSSLQSALNFIYQNKECQDKLTDAVQKAGDALSRSLLCGIEKDKGTLRLVFRNDDTAAVTSSGATTCCCFDTYENVVRVINNRFDEINESRRKAQEKNVQ